jgi:DNA polymerase I-like protein with 3'-5' exonuclease and polymerase domains
MSLLDKARKIRDRLLTTENSRINDGEEAQTTRLHAEQGCAKSVVCAKRVVADEDYVKKESDSAYEKSIATDGQQTSQTEVRTAAGPGGGPELAPEREGGAAYTPGSPEPGQETTSACGGPALAFTLVRDDAGMQALAQVLYDGVGPVAVDTETLGLQPKQHRLRLIQLHTDKGTFIVDTFQVDPAVLWPVLAGKELAAHNWMFDGAFLIVAGFPVQAPHDLMHMSRLLTADPAVRGGNSLDDIAQRELGRILDKSHQKADWSGELSPAQLAYAAADAEVTALALPKLQTKIIEAGLDRVAYLERRATPAILWMARHGVAFDRGRWEGMAEGARLEREALAEQMNAIAPPREAAWKWTSTTQMKQMFAQLGHDRPNVQDATLAGIDHPIAALLRQFRGASKRVTTYGAKWTKKHVHADGRVYPSWKQLGAVTGRMSCVAAGSRIEIVRDVSTHPKGMAVEDVRPGDLAYAYDRDGQLCLRRVLWAGKTGHKSVIRLHWRGSGHHHHGHLDLTADHRVRLTDGTYKAAGELRPGDRVMALSRDLSCGYARLYPTGADVISREHRFIFESMHGESPEHIHHRNENKLDNRTENLVGMTAREHTSLHSSRPSQELREKRPTAMRRRWQEGKVIVPVGPDNHRWLGLTKADLELLLRRYDYSVTRISRGEGIDFITLKKYLAREGFDFRELKRKNRELRREQIIAGAAHARRAKHNHEIIAVEPLDGCVDVYDLTVEDAHNFIANELCVHNCGAPNMQQLPRGGDYRRCVVAPPVRALVKADWGQLHLRIIAGYVPEPAMRKAFDAGIDIHTATAQALLGKADVTKADRQMSKACNFGLCYGMGRIRFLSHCNVGYKLDLTPEQAEGLRQNWFRVYPDVKVWHRRQIDGPVTITVPSGRRCLNVTKFSDKLSYPILMIEADILKTDLAECWERRDEVPGAFPVIACHDELVFECDSDKWPAVEAWLVDVMLGAAATWITPVPVEVGTTVGTTWGGGEIQGEKTYRR